MSTSHLGKLPPNLATWVPLILFNSFEFLVFFSFYCYCPLFSFATQVLSVSPAGGQMQNEIQILTQKYNLGYYNYMIDPRFTLYDFADSDHLSTRGAEKFSQILRCEVVTKHTK